MLLLSAKERDRLVQLREIVAGRQTVAGGARRLGLSRRHMRRLVRRYEAEGDRGLVHRARGRPPNNRKPEALRTRVLERAREPVFHDFGPTLLAEHLARDPAIGPLHPHTLRRWMIAAELWKPRRRRARHRQSRPRREAFGELVLMDTSIHRWLEDRSDEPIALIATLDDATGHASARFVERDTGLDNRRMMVDYLTRFGRPRAFYVDQAGHFGNARRRVHSRREPERIAREAEPTHSIIQRALEALDVELIFALSPQAKGRVERLFGSFQDRLVKELRVAGIGSRERANHHLETTFLPEWNQRFAVSPTRPRDAHRALPRHIDLLQLFAETDSRVIANDFTFKYLGQRLQITARQAGDLQPGQRITIEERLDGSTRFRAHQRYLQPQPVVAAPPTPKTRPRSRPTPPRPTADHPWQKPVKAHVRGWR